jgi:sugar lactone lactonase YvrE
MIDILAPQTACELGEGPVWVDDALYWFDIQGRRLHRARPGDAASKSWEFEEQVSAAGRLTDGALLVASEIALWRFDPASGERRLLQPLEADRPETRSNDGRADRQGGFWIGTMAKDETSGAQGALYRYHGGQLRTVRERIGVPNAICFAPDGRRGYFADSREHRIYTWTLDAEGWPSGEPEVFFDLSGQAATPDGAVVDGEGALWVALWNGGKVVRVLPDGSVAGEIALPATRPTCPAFGGDGRRLYVTSACIGLDAAERAAQPDAGRVFAAAIDIPGPAEPLVELPPAR